MLAAVDKLIFALFELVSADAPGLERLPLKEEGTREGKDKVAQHFCRASTIFRPSMPKA